MNCPKCNGSKHSKDGIIKNRQRYYCKGCNYRYTVERRSGTKGNETKRQALELYLEGLGFRSIGRILKVSHVSVYNWIKGFGSKLEEIRNDTPIEVVEIDEMHTYIGTKKVTAGSGLLLIGLGRNSSAVLLEVEEAKLV